MEFFERRNMKLNKKIIAVIFTLVVVVSARLVTNASVIYKDINSISIRTNFNFDFEAIQDEGLPDITYNSEGNTSDMVYVYPTAKYEIESCEWYSQGNNEFEIGGAPKVVVYLITKDYETPNSSNNDYYYRFLSSYSSSTCYISKGAFVSATRLSTSNLKVVFQLQGLKGTFNPPDSAYWEDDRGTARWDSPNVNDSGYYDLILYRDSTTIARVDKYKGNSYNFSGYFVKEGDYSFKVRTVSGTDNQATYGKNSEYVESGSINVDATTISMIAQGTNASNNNSGLTNVGWIQMNNTWYYYRPDGTVTKSDWVAWNGKWYYLDELGRMKVGILNVNNRIYYLGSDGAMATGWVNLNDTYYYFDTTNGTNYGAMVANSWIKYDNKYFYFDEKGIMVTGWKQISDSSGNIGTYYFYPKGTTEGLYGYMAANTTIDGFRLGADGKWITR